MTSADIKTFLHEHSVKELVFFTGHSHVYESYLCAKRSESARNKVILNALKLKRSKVKHERENENIWKKVQRKISQLKKLDPNIVEIPNEIYY